MNLDTERQREILLGTLTSESFSVAGHLVLEVADLIRAIQAAPLATPDDAATP